MPYNPYFPSNYPYQQNLPYQMPVNNYQTTNNSQSSSLIHVQNENQARECAVALGSSMMFIDDNAPYIYTKTAGTSQLEPAVFKRFKIIEDDISQNAQEHQEQASASSAVNLSDYMSKAEFEPFKTILDDIQKKVKELTDNEQSAE